METLLRGLEILGFCFRPLGGITRTLFDRFSPIRKDKQFSQRIYERGELRWKVVHRERCCGRHLIWFS